MYTSIKDQITQKPFLRSKLRGLAPMIPRQHGAWSMLFSCFVIGVVVGGNFGAEAFLILVSVIAGFFSQNTAGLYLRFSKIDELRKMALAWTIGYSSVFLGFGAFLIIWYKLWLLLLLGFMVLVSIVITLILRQQKKESTVAGEIVEILGLCLVAPAAEYSATRVFSTQTINLWLICSFFFVGSVFHVRYLVRKGKKCTELLLTRFKVGLPSIVYHLLVFTAAVSLGRFIGILPSLAPLALLPVTLKALWAVGRRYEKPLNIRRIGYVELIHSLIFVFLAVLTFHMPMRET